MSQNPTALCGDWLHSFEEDEGDVRVFRLARSFAFPPSRRGRERLSFPEGPGRAALGRPGPDDRTQSVQVDVTALGANRYRLGDRVVEVVEAAPDRLKLRFF